MCSWERLSLACDSDGSSSSSSSELSQRHSHAAACVGSTVWIYGGFHGGVLSDNLLELCSRDWAWRRRYASGPPATVLHTMDACGHQVILFGGLVQSEKASMAVLQTFLAQAERCSQQTRLLNEKGTDGINHQPQTIDSGRPKKKERAPQKSCSQRKAEQRRGRQGSNDQATRCSTSHAPHGPR